MRPLASIVVTSYNHGRFLRTAIDSALTQTYPDLEVIVVDDGSTDDSRNIIGEYGGRVFSVLKSNGGQGSAMNAGFRASRGEIVLFLDSDDVLLPTAGADAVERFRDQNVLKVHWPLVVIDESGRRTGEMIPPHGTLPEGDLLDQVVQRGPYSFVWTTTSGNAWARSFLDQVSPIPEDVYRTCPDAYLNALAPVLGRLATVPAPRGLYRRHPANASSALDASAWADLGIRLFDDYAVRAQRHLREMGHSVDLDAWRANHWWHQVRAALDELAAIVESQRPFLVVDHDLFGPRLLPGRVSFPFPQRDGLSWGLPLDDRSALAELERERDKGAHLLVFPWLSFWWFDHYREFSAFLRDRFTCTWNSPRFVAFDLKNTLDGPDPALLRVPSSRPIPGGRAWPGARVNARMTKARPDNLRLDPVVSPNRRISATEDCGDDESKRSQGRAFPCTPSHAGGPSDALDDSGPAAGGQA